MGREESPKVIIHAENYLFKVQQWILEFLKVIKLFRDTDLIIIRVKFIG